MKDCKEIHNGEEITIKIYELQTSTAVEPKEADEFVALVLYYSTHHMQCNYVLRSFSRSLTEAKII